MHISSHILRLALLRLFADVGFCAGDWLSHGEIGDRWAATGLRASDLKTAINDMLESGDLVSSERDGQVGFSLAGWLARSLYQPDGELQTASMDDENLLFNVRYRPRNGSDPGLRRRHGEKKD